LPPKEPSDTSIQESVLLSHERQRQQQTSQPVDCFFIIPVYSVVVVVVIVIIVVDNQDILIGSESISKSFVLP
jgi:hypothetical protein